MPRLVPRLVPRFWLKLLNDKRFENSFNNFSVHNTVFEGHTLSERQIL